MKKYILLSLIITGLFSFRAFCQNDPVSEKGMVTRTNLSEVSSPSTNYGSFTEISPSDSIFITPADEDFWVVATASADYDNDGDLDIAVIGYYVVYNVSVEEKFILMRNDGPSGAGPWKFSYISLSLGLLTTGSTDLAWGDADGDGDLDLAVGSDGATVIYRNDGGNLVLTNTVLPGYWEDNTQAYFNLHSISWVDFDNDGDMDLLIPSVFDQDAYAYKTALMRNEGPNGSGGWTFTEFDSIFAPTMHAQSAWADYDGDGDLDLLLVNMAPVYDDGFIKYYRNDGNGSFTGNNLLGSLSVEHGEAQWGDYDGDGDLDILVAGNVRETNGSYTPMVLRIYRNNGTDFTQLEVIPNPASEGWVDLTAATWADYDSDGDMDILLAGHYNSGVEIEGRARIYTNNNNVFTSSGSDLPAPHSSGTHGGAFSWLDIDMDGDLDYYIAGEYFVPGGNGLIESRMHIYRNDAQGQNSPPSIPDGLSSTQVSDGSVLLSWLPAADDHTPVDALTYDLKLFHGGMPDTLPGRLPEPGNVSSATEWSFSGLEPGNYHWTLASVDASFSGSSVAAGDFIVGPVSVNEQGYAKFSLGQNHPNPFTGDTRLEYYIPVEGRVTIVLYDNMGIEVENLVDGRQTAGEYSVTFNAAGLPGGVYYYTMRSGDFSQTRKMVVSGAGN